MTKIAIPVINGQINGHFGHTQQFFIYNVEDNKIVSQEALTPPPHEPGVFPAWLAGLGVTDVISSGMGQRAIALFNQNKVNVFVGVPEKEPQDLIMDFLNGTLETKDNTCSGGC